MGLAEYHRKRDFRKTPEPRGEVGPESGRSFCIQKHAATRLHYDFRLEMEGVLKSWAVPKGPSYDPAEKRLAMQTEDHPVDYGGFEGIIPEGEYGGGTVLLWDRGTWEPIGNPHEDLRKGSLKFVLHGEKLQGRWTLVKIKGRTPRESEKTWLLIKERDDRVRPHAEYDVTEDRPESVETGRVLEEIAKDRDKVWHSNRSNPLESKPGKSVARPARKPVRVEVEGARKGALPQTLAPQLATLVSSPPDGAGWVHELKFDGYRILARVEKGKARLISRNGKDWTAPFPEVAKACAGLPVSTALLDGEVAVVLKSGLTSFQALQNHMGGGASDGQLAYFVFDLLHLDGSDLSRSPLRARKDALAAVLAGARAPLKLSQDVGGSGPAFFREACRLGLEGIVSKRADAPYHPGRTRDWVKTKCVQHQEVVIGGYTDPGGSRVAVGALLVGVHDREGTLQYAGKVGTGYTDKVLRSLKEALAPMERKQSPFAGKVPGASAAHWVDPLLVAEVEFTEWTTDGKLRHPTFRGLREDKSPREVVREGPAAGGAEPAGKAKPAEKPAVKRTRSGATVEIEGVQITHADRAVYPEPGITKADLAQFYVDIADHVVPHVEGRPTTLVRCPEGMAAACFYQKHVSSWAPSTLRRMKIQEKTKVGEYLVVDDLAGLVGLVQIGILEIHTWNARAEDVEKPDRLVFDLDPDTDITWERTVEAALRIRGRLEELGLRSFLKTTGGKGLHIVVPLSRRSTWEDTAAFSGALAAEMVKAEPSRYTDTMSKARRKGRVFIDYLRNLRGSTSVAAYSTRAKPAAPVSTPIDWKELTPDLRPDQFTVVNLRERLRRQKKDPWADYFRVKQSLTASMMKELRVR